MEIEPIADENITLGCAEILNRGACDLIFKTYKPIQVVEYNAKWRGMTTNSYFRTNAQSRGQADANIFTLELTDMKTKEVQYKNAIPVGNKQQGKMQTSMACLSKLFGA